MNTSAVFMCALLVGVCSGARIIPFPNVFDNVKQNEHILFLKYHLLMGYSSLQSQSTALLRAEAELPSGLIFKIQQIPTPNNFDQKLFRWTARTYGLSNDQMYSLARGQVVCFDDDEKNCIDLGDVGSICCT